MFFEQPIETFFFANFAKSPQASAFIQSKSNMSSENIKRLTKYTAELGKVSVKALEKMQNEKVFLQYLK